MTTSPSLLDYELFLIAPQPSLEFSFVFRLAIPSLCPETEAR
jgi:hypothetical protein